MDQAGQHYCEGGPLLLPRRSFFVSLPVSAHARAVSSLPKFTNFLPVSRRALQIGNTPVAFAAYSVISGREALAPMRQFPARIRIE